MCVTLYLLLGFAGVPVFASWSSGPEVLGGPTGGYLLGYLLIAFFTGWFTRLGKGKVPMIFIGTVIGTLGCYAIGTLWLGMQLSLSVKAALMLGVLPFIPGDLIKIALSLGVALPMKKQLSEFLNKA
jgi:biotin transport system substrate-specific component